jgi:hypothetical protein
MFLAPVGFFVAQVAGSFVTAGAELVRHDVCIVAFLLAAVLTAGLLALALSPQQRSAGKGVPNIQHDELGCLQTKVCATVKLAWSPFTSGNVHVDGNRRAWWRWSLSPRHDRHDGGPESIGRFCAAGGAEQSSSDAAAWLLLGRARHAPGPIVQRNNHDHNRSRQRRLVDVSAGAGPRLRRECRHDGYRLAGRAHWRSRLAYRGRTADYLLRGADQALGQRAAIGSRCRACRRPVSFRRPPW